MKTFLTTGRMSMPAELEPRGETPGFVSLGAETELIVRRWGKGGLGVEWKRMRLGLRAQSGATLSFVWRERAEFLRGYQGVATNLGAIPLYGYRWRSEDDWTKVRPGWALGFFDPESGFLLVGSNAGDQPRPVVVEWPEARGWLLSESWEQMRLLRAADECLP